MRCINLHPLQLSTLWRTVHLYGFVHNFSLWMNRPPQILGSLILSFLVDLEFSPYGMISAIGGLVSVHLCELKELVVIRPFYGLKKFHLFGIICPTCGLCILTAIFMGFKGFTRPGLPVQLVDFVLTVHFY